jgi:hypothetical protein
MACEFTLRLSMEVCVKQNKNIVQGSLFEDDYLMRTLGNIARDSDYALTELVANAWDAGATEVKITIPTQAQDIIRISDNGHGMTSSEFKRRWMWSFRRALMGGKGLPTVETVSGGTPCFVLPINM